MNWKLYAVIGTVLLLLIALGYYYSIESVQGFQNGQPLTKDRFTMCYADWCPHCTTAKPAFKEFSKDGKLLINGKEVHVRMLEADKDKDAMASLPVKGFPTFLLETVDGKVIEYKGPRETEKYLEFLNKQLGGGI
jgi:thiol-disulfide isomerase/thioredoxin